jgi:RNA polymerase sigma-70 factor (ECF subfamily)
VTDEDHLLERARAYDGDALAEVYDTYAPLIYAYIYRRVQNAPLAEDLTGEVFLRMLQAVRHRETWHTSFRGWLYRVAHNLVVDHFRREPAQAPLALDEWIVASGNSPEAEVAERMSRRALQEAIEQLTPDQQQVLVLRFGQQLTTREVGETIGKSISAVEALQHRALAALRRIFEKQTLWE